jgi:hypothetical protein
LAAIERLLDEGVGREGVEDLSLVQRVQVVTVASNSWSDLAIKRLHQIHQLSGDECEFCSKWLDGSAQLPISRPSFCAARTPGGWALGSGNRRWCWARATCWSAVEESILSTLGIRLPTPVEHEVKERLFAIDV